jgi:2-amino-4-hydroxy-6-hydroxymethyldihydropteridine diphosphokinase
MSEAHTAALLLGSNVGDRLKMLREGVLALEARCGQIVSISSVYQTAPWGNTEQEDFYNQAVLLRTILTAGTLLEIILQIEKDHGRNRTEKWGARTLDIDILFFDEEVINKTELTVPHPYLPQRRFSLVCLDEIAPGWIHPVLHKTTSELLAACPDDSDVAKLEPEN